jgi:hypothetical protein
VQRQQCSGAAICGRRPNSQSRPVAVTGHGRLCGLSTLNSTAGSVIKVRAQEQQHKRGLRANAGDRRSHAVWNDSWRLDGNSRPKRLEVVQCRKAIVPNDTVPEDARNAHVPCPQAMPPLSMAGARDLHLFGSVQCK